MAKDTRTPEQKGRDEAAKETAKLVALTTTHKADYSAAVSAKKLMDKRGEIAALNATRKERALCAWQDRLAGSDMVNNATDEDIKRISSAESRFSREEAKQTKLGELDAVCETLNMTPDQLLEMASAVQEAEKKLLAEASDNGNGKSKGNGKGNGKSKIIDTTSTPTP